MQSIACGRSKASSYSAIPRILEVQKMAQKIVGFIKLQIPAGQSTPAPPVGPSLGQNCVNIMAFTKEFNERTKNDMGLIIPVVITVYADRSFSFITKTPPAAVLIKKACGIESGSGVPNKTKVATITGEQVRKIAEQKMPDLNAAIIEIAASISAALRSGIFCSAIFLTCSPVIVATFVLFGTPEPLSIPHAFLIRTAAGGVFVINVNERSA